MKNWFYILFLFINYFSFSQETVFNYTYNQFVLSDLNNVIETDSGYICLGGGRNTFSSNEKLKTIVLNINKFGSINWIKSYGNEDYDWYFGTRNSLISNTDGGYSLSGSLNNEINNICLFIKFDNNLDTLWSKRYFENPDYTVFYNHIQTSDGGYVLVGCSAENDPDGDVLLVKTDSDGNMQWYKKYGTSARDFGICIVPTQDGGFLIGGTSDGYGNIDGYLLKVDSLGNLQWTRHYGNPLYPDGTIYTILRNGNDEYYIALTSYVIEPISASFYMRRYSIIKLDSDFNEVWNNIYGVEAEYTSLGTMTIAENGDILATVEDNYQYGLMRISPDGDSIWKRYYVAPDVTNELCGLLALKQTQDNGFIMAGVAFAPQVMWLVKTDSCGCVTDDCDCGENAVQQFGINAGIQVFPNPSIQDFTVNLDLTDYNNTELKITDLNGHLKSVIPVTGKTTEIETKGWSAGIYICSLFTDGKLVNVGKLVLE